MSDEVKFDFDKYLSFPREKIFISDFEIGMLIYSDHEGCFFLIKDLVSPYRFGVTLLCRGLPLEVAGWNVFSHYGYELVSRTGLVIGARIEQVSPERKDYCHSCKNDNLVWVMMAARCSHCNQIILGGA